MQQIKVNLPICNFAKVFPLIISQRHICKVCYQTKAISQNKPLQDLTKLIFRLSKNNNILPVVFWNRYKLNYNIKMEKQTLKQLTSTLTNECEPACKWVIEHIYNPYPNKMSFAGEI